MIHGLSPVRAETGWLQSISRRRSQKALMLLVLTCPSVDSTLGGPGGATRTVLERWTRHEQHPSRCLRQQQRRPRPASHGLDTGMGQSVPGSDPWRDPSKGHQAWMSMDEHDGMRMEPSRLARSGNLDGWPMVWDGFDVVGSTGDVTEAVGEVE